MGVGGGAQAGLEGSSSGLRWFDLILMQQLNLRFRGVSWIWPVLSAEPRLYGFPKEIHVSVGFPWYPWLLSFSSGATEIDDFPGVEPGELTVLWAESTSFPLPTAQLLESHVYLQF